MRHFECFNEMFCLSASPSGTTRPLTKQCKSKQTMYHACTHALQSTVITAPQATIQLKVQDTLKARSTCQHPHESAERMRNGLWKITKDPTQTTISWCYTGHGRMEQVPNQVHSQMVLLGVQPKLLLQGQTTIKLMKQSKDLHDPALYILL